MEHGAAAAADDDDSDDGELRVTERLTDMFSCQLLRSRLCICCYVLWRATCHEVSAMQ